jgi:glycosyltransferase involved in cell wall biosynthesis
VLTIGTNDNKYTQWLNRKYGEIDSIEFAGFMNKIALYSHYSTADCLVFPSKVETWGLPISEFATTGKPMLLADLPYAHETSAGSKQVAFFNPEKPEELKVMMRRLIEGDSSFLKEIQKKKIEEPKAENWEELFDILLND